jgi:hypothetical protein
MRVRVVPSRELRQWRWARSRRRAVRSEATTDRRPRVAVSCSAAQERVTATRFGPGIRPFMRLPKLGSDAERNVSSRYEGGNSTIEAFPTPNCSTVGENWRRSHPTQPLSHRDHSHSVAACTPTGPSRPTRAPPAKPQGGSPRRQIGTTERGEVGQVVRSQVRGHRSRCVTRSAIGGKSSPGPAPRVPIRRGPAWAGGPSGVADHLARMHRSTEVVIDRVWAGGWTVSESELGRDGSAGLPASPGSFRSSTGRVSLPSRASGGR